MKTDRILLRKVLTTAHGRRYREGSRDGMAIHIVFDESVRFDPADIPQKSLKSLFFVAERDGRAVDVFLPWSLTFSHRLVVVTDEDFAEIHGLGDS